MRMGFAGLGKMGANMLERLLQAKHEVEYDPSKTNIQQLAEAINKTGYKASSPE